MKKITVNNKNFTVSNQQIETIIVTLRNVSTNYSANFSTELQTHIKALWENTHYMKFHTGPNRHNWLINMMFNGETIMKIATKTQSQLLRPVMDTIQQIAGENLASEAIGPHQNYWTSGMSGYCVLESDCFSKYYATFTIQYVRTYANAGAIILFPDHTTRIYRLGSSTSKNLSGWTQLYGGFKGFAAIKYYLSEMMRNDFRRVNADAFKSAWGYVPYTDEIRELPYAPSCTLTKLHHFDKPTYVLNPNHPNISQWKKATY